MEQNASAAGYLLLLLA